MAVAIFSIISYPRAFVHTRGVGLCRVALRQTTPPTALGCIYQPFKMQPPPVGVICLFVMPCVFPRWVHQRNAVVGLCRACGRQPRPLRWAVVTNLFKATLPTSFCRLLFSSTLPIICTKYAQRAEKSRPFLLVSSERGALNKLVYPSGFEPEVDGVGGRNVIQLHYEYVWCGNII